MSDQTRFLDDLVPVEDARLFDVEFHNQVTDWAAELKEATESEQSVTVELIVREGPDILSRHIAGFVNRD